MNLYVGNLSFQMREEDLKELFEAFGEVTSVKIITDRETGRSKGFGFVELANQEDGERAIQELNNKEVKGRNMKVNEARQRTERGGGGGWGQPRY
jgi:RNA recognition motif-containing protein